jgi:hypothetical protein
MGKEVVLDVATQESLAWIESSRVESRSVSREVRAKSTRLAIRFLYSLKTRQSLRTCKPD